MAVETNIILEFRGIPLVIPETTVVTLKTRVRFVIRLYRSTRELMDGFRGSNRFLDRIELYFSDGRPLGFEERQYSTRIQLSKSDRAISTSEEYEDIILAQGIADSIGTYKYGVRGFSSNNEEIFDEDPYLIVLSPGYKYGFPY